MFSESTAAAENDMNWVGADGSGTPGFPADKPYTIDRVYCQGAVNLIYIVLRRTGHPSSDFTIPASVLTGADEGDAVFDFHKIFGAGLELNANEVLHVWSANGAAGPTVVTAFVQISTDTKKSNYRAIRVAGSAAALATPAGPVVSDANIVYPTNMKYTLRGLWFESTTAVAAVVRNDARQIGFVRGHTAPGIGYDAADIDLGPAAAKNLTGQDMPITIAVVATAADAAAVQFLIPYFEIGAGL